MLKKKISSDEKLESISVKAALLFTWMLAHLDVKGRHSANILIIKGSVVPLRKDFDVKNIPTMLKELESVGLIKLYESNGRKCLCYLNFDKNQRLREDREAPSSIPAPDDILLPDNSRITPGESRGKLREVKLSKEKLSEKPDILSISSNEKQEAVICPKCKGIGHLYDEQNNYRGKCSCKT